MQKSRKKSDVRGDTEKFRTSDIFVEENYGKYREITSPEQSRRKHFFLSDDELKEKQQLKDHIKKVAKENNLSKEQILKYFANGDKDLMFLSSEDIKRYKELKKLVKDRKKSLKMEKLQRKESDVKKASKPGNSEEKSSRNRKQPEYHQRNQHKHEGSSDQNFTKKLENELKNYFTSIKTVINKTFTEIFRTLDEHDRLAEENKRLSETKLHCNERMPIVIMKTNTKEGHNDTKIKKKDSHHDVRIHKKGSHNDVKINKKESCHDIQINKNVSHNDTKIIRKESHHDIEIHKKDSYHEAKIINKRESNEELRMIPERRRTGRRKKNVEPASDQKKDKVPAKPRPNLIWQTFIVVDIESSTETSSFIEKRKNSPQFKSYYNYDSVPDDIIEIRSTKRCLSDDSKINLDQHSPKSKIPVYNKPNLATSDEITMKRYVDPDPVEEIDQEPAFMNSNLTINNTNELKRTFNENDRVLRLDEFQTDNGSAEKKSPRAKSTIPVLKRTMSISSSPNSLTRQGDTDKTKSPQLSHFEKRKMYGDILRKTFKYNNEAKLMPPPQTVEIRFVIVENQLNHNVELEQNQVPKQHGKIEIKTAKTKTLLKPPFDHASDTNEWPCLELVSYEGFDELYDLADGDSLHQILNENKQFLSKNFTCSKWYDLDSDHTIYDEVPKLSEIYHNNKFSEDSGTSSRDKTISSCSPCASEESGFATLKSKEGSTASFFKRPSIKKLLEPATSFIDSKTCFNTQKSLSKLPTTTTPSGTNTNNKPSRKSTTQRFHKCIKRIQKGFKSFMN